MARAPVSAFPRTPWRWAVAGVLLGLAVALIGFAPASWLAASVARASGGQLLLAEPRGTLWTGTARLVLTGGAGSNDAAALPGRVEWRVRPGWGYAAVYLQAPCCTAEPLRVQASPRWGGAQFALDNSQSQWPAGVLAGLGTPWNTVQPEGALGLQTEGLSVEWVEGRVLVTGSARLEASRISSRLSTLKPMGSYRITLKGGPVATLQLETLEGSLQLSGTGRWVGSRLRFEGVASAAPEREAALANLLNIIGRRNGARSIITVG